MPSIAFIAILIGSQAGSSRNGQVSPEARTPAVTAAPTASEAANADNVTWFAVTPAAASSPTAGRNHAWNAGFKSYSVCAMPPQPSPAASAQHTVSRAHCQVFRRSAEARILRFREHRIGQARDLARVRRSPLHPARRQRHDARADQPVSRARLHRAAAARAHVVVHRSAGCRGADRGKRRVDRSARRGERPGIERVSCDGRASRRGLPEPLVRLSGDSRAVWVRVRVLVRRVRRDGSAVRPRAAAARALRHSRCARARCGPRRSRTWGSC